MIEDKQHFPGRERDEKEVLGYYAALEKLEQVAEMGKPVTENHIQTLHALVMAEGRKKVKPTPRQRKGVELFRHSASITSHDVGVLFSISDRAARNLISTWVDDGFVVITDSSKKSRKYGLAHEFQSVVKG